MADGESWYHGRPSLRCIALPLSMINYFLLSVVIPLFNEEGNIRELYRRICAVMGSPLHDFEILFVDDGSTDASADLIAELHASDSRVGLLRLSRNFGHQAALMAGLDHARGDAVIVMDADLQHPPELLPQLIERWRAGAQVVQMIRRSSDSTAKLKRFASARFYGMMRRIANIAIIPNAADFFLLDRCVVDALNQCRENSRFTRGLLSWIGFRHEFLTYDCGARFAGRTKYSWCQMLHLAADGVFAFSAAPLRLAGIAGLIVTILGVAYLLYAVIMFLFGGAVPGWTSLMAVVVFMSGIQLMILWIMGEFIAHIARQTRNRPSYIIAESVPAHCGSER